MRCMNPSKRYCECHACGEEKRHLDHMRNRSQYERYNNPLISWTFSEEWTQPPALPKVRGMSETNGMHTAHFSGEVVGEIPWRKFDGLSRKFI